MEPLKRGHIAIVVLTAVGTIMFWLYPFLPYLLVPEFHSTDIVLEEMNTIRIPFDVGTEIIRSAAPENVGLSESTAFMFSGFGRLHMGDRSYPYVFLYFITEAPDLPIRIRPSASPRHYLLGFFSNSSELGELLRSHGFPHTLVKADYQSVSEESMSRTRIFMTHVNDSPLFELSALSTDANARVWESSRHDWYYVNNDTLVVLSETERTNHTTPWRVSYANVSFAANTAPWEYVGRIEYAIDIQCALLAMATVDAEIGWLPWEYPG